MKLPLAFVRGGYTTLINGSISYFGDYGYSWSRTSLSVDDAYYFSVAPNDANPSSYFNRWIAFPPPLPLPR